MSALPELRQQHLKQLVESVDYRKQSELLDLIPDPGPTLRERSCAVPRAREMRRPVSELPRRERRVIVASFGLNRTGELSLSQSARRCGFSKPEAWRRRQRGLELLRARMGPAEEWL
jgi:DNA-directed RNA polymerase specialized sigma24 family protein